MERAEASRDFAGELEVATVAARAAGAAIRDLYDRAAAGQYRKSDGSPVTDADLAADGIIRAELSRAFPGDAILTEEGADDPARLGARRVWVVDPIDGTQHFIDRTGEFDVLIALAVDGRPVVGVVYQPTADLLLAGLAGRGAWVERGGDRRPLTFRSAASPPRLATSTWLGASDNGALLARVARRLGAPAPVVTGHSISPRLFVPPDDRFDALIGLDQVRPTMAWEWDLAAADVIVNAAGGTLTDPRGRPHRYNKPVPRNEGGLVMSADPALHARLVEAIGEEC